MRPCSECPKDLDALGLGPHQITCSDSCRAKRSRRLRAIKRDEENYAETHGLTGDEVRLAVRRELTPDVISTAAQEVVTPLVREAITEETVRAIKDLVGLTPLAVTAIEKDLTHKNAMVRQKAYSLLLKYTVGHPAVVQPEDTAPAPGLTVNFNMPRPGDPDTEDEPVDADEIRECDICHAEKPAAEFEGDSDRCKECFANLKIDVLKAHGLL